jgi:NADPH-dependent ferric siderophore reductase
LEELPAGTRAVAIIEVADAGEEQRLTSRARLDVRWLHRNDAAPGETSLLHNAIAGLSLPPGEGYAWASAEAATAKALRRHLVDERGVRKDRVKAAAYWKRGAVAVHETYDD